MKIALVTTTIEVPTVLALYKKFASNNLEIFVTGDLKTPIEAKEWCTGQGIVFSDPEYQKRWKSSETIGWNTDSRRNFAILDALEWGAELIITIDSDMIPSPTFFNCFERLFDHEWSGLQLGVQGLWLDHGQFTEPKSPARGLPAEVIKVAMPDHVVSVEIGIAQGSILGVPDTDAMTAVTQHPMIHSISDVLRYGFVAHPGAYAVFNSQITAFRRELAPAAVQFYREQHRNTDIFASLVMRRIARELGLYTHYGLPMGFHARKSRSLWNDVQAERWGMDNIVEFNDELEQWKPHKNAYAYGMQDFYAKSKVCSHTMKKMIDLWIQDCDEAMK